MESRQDGVVHEEVSRLIELALEEDLGSGDVTSEFFVPRDRPGRAFVVAKGTGIVAGVEVARRVFQQVEPTLEVDELLSDGAAVAPGAYVMEIRGQARAMLSAERVALNFLQHLSGIATCTNHFVETVRDSGARIVDTRKTTPGWRSLEKAAVVAGGGSNHRRGLYDMVMVKDNHLVVEDGIDVLRDAIRSVKAAHPGMVVEVEADTLEQAVAFLDLDGVDAILLDNMENEQMRKIVEKRGERDRPILEASGGVSLDTVRGIAETGVERISVGLITHSAPALDLSLEFVDPGS